MGKRRLILYMCALIVACAPPPVPAPVPVPPPPVPDTAKIPLTDLGRGTYRGLQGGLYPGGSNTMPSDHLGDGIVSRGSIARLDVNGRESVSGRIVLLSIGGGNATEEWCSDSSAPPCDPMSFSGRAVTDQSVDHGAVVIVNGAMPGKSALDWATRTSREYDRIRDTRLAPLGLSEKQVQVVWLQITDSAPTVSLPAREADAYLLRDRLSDVMISLKSRYPNLALVFLSSRMYGGFSRNAFLGEPFSYESGFAVKWLIQSHITDKHSPNNGTSVGPWIAWGPYLWADSAKARLDGLAWKQEDFKSDGVNLSESGQSKAGQLLLDFFKHSELTSCWFLAHQTCPAITTVR